MYTVLYMPATRTQIYLPRELRDMVDDRAHREGKSMAQLIREALEAYLGSQSPDAATALDQTFGSMPDLDVPGREEWERG